MAALDLVPVSVGVRTATAQLVLRAAAAPTTSYVATTNTVNTIGWEYVHFALAYTNGDETSIQIVPQLYDGTTWHDASFKATQATAVSEVTSDVLNLTKATMSTRYGAGTLGNFVLPPVSCIGFQQARLVVKSTGGTPTGTIGVTVTGSITVKTR